MIKKKSERTKERILEEAVDIFIREGYAASRTNEIAKAAEVSEATLFKYFKSKQGLLDSVVSVFLDQISEKIIVGPLDKIFEDNKTEPPIVMYKKLFMNRIRLIQGFRKYGIVAITESRFDKTIRKKLESHIFPEIMEFSERVVNHYKEKGVFRQDLDPWIMMRTAMASVVGMMLTAEFLHIEPRNGSLENELDLVLEFILNGAMTPEAQMKLRGEENE